MKPTQYPLQKSGLVARVGAASGFVAALGDWREPAGPAYQRLARAVSAAIASGVVTAGTRVPAERELAGRLAVSRTTVVSAYALLRADGWIESRHGSGSWSRFPGGVVNGRGSRSSGGPQRASRLLGRINGDIIDLRCASLPELGPLAKPFLSFGPELSSWADETRYSPLGLRELRRAIARHVSGWGLPTREEQVVVTAGAQQAMSLVASLFVRRDDPVAIEDPTHIGTLDVLQGAGARLLPVLVGKDGIRLDALRRIIDRERPRLISLVPTFQNPTGTVYTEPVRQRIARLCEEVDIPLVENNALGDLALDVDPPPPIAAFSKEAPILTVGSLSKLVWTGLRIGWIRAPEHIIARLAPLKAVNDYGTSVMSQAVALKFFWDADRIVEFRRRQLVERRARLFRELYQQLPSWTHTRPPGGPSTWVRLPQGNAVEFAPVALRHGVTVLPGDIFSPAGGFSDFLRLPFVLDLDIISQGVTRLARAWKEYVPAARAKRPLAVLA
jgi:DNA-binding transcriptional MocR family regulator